MAPGFVNQKCAGLPCASIVVLLCAPFRCCLCLQIDMPEAQQYLEDQLNIRPEQWCHAAVPVEEKILSPFARTELPGNLGTATAFVKKRLEVCLAHAVGQSLRIASQRLAWCSVMPAAW